MAPHILVLEDDFYVQRVWRDVLANYSSVHIVSCPATARTVLATGFKPDIIFSDWDMPGESGGEFCAFLRTTDTQTPIVLLSGLDRCDAAQRAGATAFWLKPFRASEVDRTIASLVRRPSARPRSMAPPTPGAAI